MKGNLMDKKKVFELPAMFRALRHRNFRLFFMGQGISLIGTWLQSTAMSWLVYRLTGSAFLLGVVGFCSTLPLFVLSPFAGVLSDRWKRRTILRFTQSLALIQASIIAVLVMTNTVQPWHIIGLSLFLGIINSFDVPARQSFMMEMVDDNNDLSNAISLNSALVNSARLIGPAIAGILIALVGEGACFTLNALSFIAVIYALNQMKVRDRAMTHKNERILSGLKTGFEYVIGFRPIRSILLNMSLVTLIGLPYVTLMPVFAKNVFHGGPHTMGFLISSIGAGALCGAVYLASRKNVLGLGRYIYMAGILYGTAMAVFSFTPLMPVAMLVLFFSGAGMVVMIAASNTILQTISDEDKRGRVMSFWSLTAGMSTFGNLIYGSLASAIGAPRAVTVGGCIVVIGARVFSRELPKLREIVRPIYIKHGIIKELNAGIYAAANPVGIIEKKQSR
jgi:MFS family permease